MKVRIKLGTDIISQEFSNIIERLSEGQNLNSRLELLAEGSQMSQKGLLKVRELRMLKLIIRRLFDFSKST